VKVFVDTSALLALGNPSDGKHDDAVTCYDGLENTALVTSDYVIDETLTRWLTSGRAREGLAFVDALLASPRYELLFVDRDAFDEALARARKYAEHELSFTDCTIVVLAERTACDAIFTFDDGFALVGCDVIPASKTARKRLGSPRRPGGKPRRR
jgi:predicted nucleic acid-binding protein